MPIWNDTAEATVFWVSMRIHQPDFVTVATLVFFVTVVVVVDWATAGEAPTIPNAPKRATAITTLIHCFRVFISFDWFCFLRFASIAPKCFARNEIKTLSGAAPA